MGGARCGVRQSQDAQCASWVPPFDFLLGWLPLFFGWLEFLPGWLKRFLAGWSLLLAGWNSDV